VDDRADDFMLRYAACFSTTGIGIDFGANDKPDYHDFAYLAFNRRYDVPGVGHRDHPALDPAHGVAARAAVVRIRDGGLLPCSSTWWVGCSDARCVRTALRGRDTTDGVTLDVAHSDPCCRWRSSRWAIVAAAALGALRSAAASLWRDRTGESQSV